MQKILIIGSGGAGKSTFARELAQRLQLEVIHLDTYYWKAGWTEPPTNEWRQTIETFLQRDSWVMDGNYGKTLDLRLPAADTIIFLDMPRIICLWRIVKRRFQYAGKTRPDRPTDCHEQLNWEFVHYVWGYPDRKRPSILEKLRDRPANQTVIVLRSPAQVRDFFANLETQSQQ
jgi:adenylate kinase family enzyme